MSGLQVGGAVRQEAAYAPREADSALPAHLRAMRLCYVLAPRQMGKSSLRVRVAARMQAEGFAIASVDLSALGTTGLTPDVWFLSLACEIADALGWEDPVAAWVADEGRSPAQRWLRALRRGLARSQDRVILFLDEIDAVRALPFTGDDFFAAIRAATDLRVEDPAWARISFCLLGVASPNQLISDPNRTPFNVGFPVALDDLSAQETLALLPSLGPLGGEALPALERTFYWTSGHPYQTNQILDALLVRAGEGDIASRVDAEVERLFFSARPDASMGGIAKSVLESPDAVALLMLYQRLLAGELIAPNEREIHQTALRLCGLAGVRDGRVVVRNRILARAFDAAWVDAQLGSRVLRRAALRWLRGGRMDADLPDAEELIRLEALAVASELEREESEFLLRARARVLEARARRRTRQLLGITLSFGLAVLLVSAWAWRSEREAMRLEAMRTLALAEQQADSPGQTSAAIRSALTAWEALQNTPLAHPATQALVDALRASRGSFVSTGGPSYTILRTDDGLIVGGQHPTRVADPDLNDVRDWPGVRGVKALVASSDGGRLLVGTLGGAVMLLDASDLHVLVEIAPPPPEDGLTPLLRAEPAHAVGGPLSMGFTSEGTAFWIDPNGRLWRLEGDAAREVGGDVPFVRATRLSEGRIAAVTAEGELRIIGAAGELAQRLGPFVPLQARADCTGDPRYLGALLDLAASPDGRAVAVVGRGGAFARVDVDSGETLLLRSAESCISRVIWVGDTLVTSADPGVLAFWSASSGALRVRRADLGQNANVMLASPNSRLVATGGFDDTVRLWDVETGSSVWVSHLHDHVIHSLAFSADGRTLYSAGGDGRLGEHPVGAALSLGSFVGGPGVPSGLGVSDGVAAVAWTDAPLQLLPLREGGDAPWAALRGIDAEDVHFGDHRAIASTRAGTLLVREGEAASGPYPGRTMARLSPWRADGGAWVARDVAGTVYVHDREGVRLAELPVEHNLEAEPIFSPDGGSLLLFGRDFGVRVHDLRSGKTTLLGHHLEPVTGGAWSPSGDALVSIGQDNRMRLFDLRRATQRLEFDLGGNGWVAHWLGRIGRILVVQQNRRMNFFSEDGERLISQDTGRGAIRSAIRSPDDTVLATSAEDGEVCLWDLATGDLIARMPSHEGTARLLRFTPDGQTLVSAGDDGQVVLLPGSTAAIVRFACARVRRASGVAPTVCASL